MLAAAMAPTARSSARCRASWRYLMGVCASRSHAWAGESICVRYFRAKLNQTRTSLSTQGVAVNAAVGCARRFAERIDGGTVFLSME